MAVLTLAAYQRDYQAAMRAFNGNSAQHVANDLSRGLMAFKIEYPPVARAAAVEPDLPRHTEGGK